MSFFVYNIIYSFLVFYSFYNFGENYAGTSTVVILFRIYLEGNVLYGKTDYENRGENR